MGAQIDVQSTGRQETARHAQGHAHSDSSRALSWRFPNKPDQLHPILVNFTAALLPLALLSDVLGRLLRRPALYVTGFWLILYGAAITPFTALAGWWWKTTAHTGTEHAALMTVHEWLGSAAAVLFVVLATWRWRIYRSALPPTIQYLAVAALVVIALVYQGSLGGEMAFGH
jgi:uncharacterized membrane protein